MTQSSHSRASSESVEEITTKTKKKSEARRKRLLKKMERDIKAIQHKKDLNDEEEEKAEEARLRLEFAKEMKQHDEDAREFFHNEDEWKIYVGEMNQKLQVTSPVLQARQTPKSSFDANLSDDESETSMVLDKTEARTLLETHILSKASKKTTTSDSSNDSDDTNVAGCSSKKVRTPVRKTLTNLTSTGVKHVVYCKAKILVKKSDTPTKTMVKTFGAFFTTLLKIDKQLKVFKYKDKTNTSFLSRPDQIPETPSQVKAFFHGSYRPKSDSYQIWPELKIGLSMDIENFIGDAKCLLEDKKLGALYKKDLQAEETEDIGFFLFSNRFQDTKRLANSIKLEIGRQFKFVPDLNLRWRKLYDPMKKKQDKNLNKDDVKAIFIEVIKGQDEKIARAIMKLYSKSNKTHIDGEK